MIEYLETFADCDLEVGWCSKLNELIGFFKIPLAQRHTDIKI